MKLRRIYFLPNLLTIINIFLGFLSLLATYRGNYSLAAFWIIIAAVMDAIDGIIARATKTQSDFGIQLDSLADAFSFGAAPAFLLYFWGFMHVGPSSAGIFFSFIFLAAGILRLARYNTLQKTTTDRKLYTGLTVPSASLLIVAIVFYHPQPITVKLHTLLLALLASTLAFFMISSIPYKNFLNFNFRQIIDLKTSLIITIIFTSLIIFPKILLLIVFSINVLSGPATYIFNYLKKKVQKKEKQKEAKLP
ncbi:MAG: CDP-diacylglycerol--serine O-phosphatidyltransferase [Candidatus Aminicenantaceae bacterium]